MQIARSISINIKVGWDGMVVFCHLAENEREKNLKFRKMNTGNKQTRNLVYKGIG